MESTEYVFQDAAGDDTQIDEPYGELLVAIVMYDSTLFL